MITIYTDGACEPNPGKGGWAAIIFGDGPKREIFGNEPHTTNNRMEMMAALRGLESIPDGSLVNVVTDSKYLQLGMTTWIKSWRRSNWKKGKVKNQDLWQRLAVQAERHKVSWQWVRGHNGHDHNERADFLAAAAIHR